MSHSQSERRGKYAAEDTQQIKVKADGAQTEVTTNEAALMREQQQQQK